MVKTGQVQAKPTPIASSRTGDVAVPVLHIKTGRESTARDDDPTKRYSLPVEIDIDHLHDPNYRISLPRRGRAY